MGWLKQIFSRRRRYDEIAKAIGEHLEEKIEDLMEDGLSREEATRKARREFGNVTLIEERSREVWQWPRLESLIQDLRFGARMLLKQPGFTLIAALTLALGIGANITIFSVVNAVLLRPLPYPESEQLVFLWSESPQRNIKERTSAWANVADWRNQSQSFAEIAVFDPTVMTLTGEAEPEPVVIVGASANLFSLLGVAPVLGR